MSIVGASALLLSASVAFAEEGPANTAQRVEANTVRAVAATTTRATTQVRQEVQTTAKQAALEKMQTAREEAKKKMQTAREEAKTRVEASREEAKVRMEAQKEKAEARLMDIQDKKKQQLAGKVAVQFEKLNKTWTDHFLKLFERYDEILQKMRDRAGVAAEKGKDVTAANAVIEAAGTAIESARNAVVAQAAKTYTLDTSIITTSTEATTTPAHQEELMKGLRTAFQTLHSALFKDLFALRDGVMKDARGAVQNALQSLGKIPKVDDDNETATSTANQ